MSQQVSSNLFLVLVCLSIFTVIQSYRKKNDISNNGLRGHGFHQLGKLLLVTELPTVSFFINFKNLTIFKASGPLTYYGGLVNANTQVIQVLWGTGSYDSHVSSTSTPSVATFYQQLLTNGPFTTWCT